MDGAKGKEKPTKAKKLDDNLKPFKGQIERTSLNRSEYGKDGLVQKPEKAKSTSNLRNEGNFNWETGRYEYSSAEGQEKTEKAPFINYVISKNNSGPFIINVDGFLRF